MIKYYHQTLSSKLLKEVESFKDGSWVYVEIPTEEELNKLALDLNLELGHLKDALDPNEVPRLEIEDSTLYIFRRVPYEENNNFSTITILFILGNNYVVTITLKHLAFFDKYFNGNEGLPTTHKIKLFVQLFSDIDSFYNTALTIINRKIYNSSVKLDRIQNRDIIEFITYEQIFNDFLNALTRTNIILNDLLSNKIISLAEEEHDLLEDLFLANGQLVESAKNSLQNVKNIRDAYSTILTNNLNRIIKLLTSLTIILTIPTMIASFFGMNVKVPFAEYPLAFLIIFIIAFGICIALVYLFSKKDWF